MASEMLDMAIIGGRHRTDGRVTHGTLSVAVAVAVAARYAKGSPKGSSHL